jgi:hypothetical protein
VSSHSCNVRWYRQVRSFGWAVIDQCQRSTDSSLTTGTVGETLLLYVSRYLVVEAVRELVANQRADRAVIPRHRPVGCEKRRLHKSCNMQRGGCTDHATCNVAAAQIMQHATWRLHRSCNMQRGGCTNLLASGCCYRPVGPSRMADRALLRETCATGATHSELGYASGAEEL